ncbi:MAG: DNA polymerase III subunit [Planctomycetota bacterium]|jgi:DNA polymerase-3 subunit delta'
MSLKDIYCQDKAVSILLRSLANDKLAGAYIFAGSEGVGKFSLAKEWGKLLLCEKPKADKDFRDSCGNCESCRLIEAGSHPDFNHIYKELSEFTRDGKGKTNPVDLPKDVVREFLIEKVSQKPALSQRKVFIVSQAERLNIASQNSLLKVLEEPPAYCFIVLLCTRLEKLLPTTKSRCQVIHFGPIAEKIIIDKLTHADLEEKKANYFARLSQGSIGKALKWAQLELAEAQLYKTKKELIQTLTTYKYADALRFAEKILGESKNISAKWAQQDTAVSKRDINRRTHKFFIQIIISALHDAMKLKVDANAKIINTRQKEKIKLLSKNNEVEELMAKISAAHKATLEVDASVNEKLIFEQLLLNLVDSDRISV